MPSPRGMSNPGGSLAETACRELAEEAGIARRTRSGVGMSNVSARAAPDRGDLLSRAVRRARRAGGAARDTLVQRRRSENAAFVRRRAASPRPGRRAVLASRHSSILYLRVPWPAAFCYVAVAIVLADGSYSTETCNLSLARRHGPAVPRLRMIPTACLALARGDVHTAWNFNRNSFVVLLSCCGPVFRKSREPDEWTRYQRRRSQVCQK